MVVQVDLRHKAFEGIMANKGHQEAWPKDDLSILKAGDKVEYYSKTHQHFVEGEVLDVEHNEAGEITRVDLSCKKRADLSKIRRTKAQYKLGDLVDYWSDSYSRWMPCRVQKVHEDGYYDLEVKKMAVATKMRPRREPPQEANSGAAAVEPAAEPAVDDEAKPGENPVAQCQGSPGDCNPPPYARDAATSNASEVSTAASLVASGVPYRELPADMIFLGSGLEFAPKRKGHTSKGYCASTNRSGGLLAGDLILENDVFDPSEPRLCTQLAEKLGSFSGIEAMKGFAGGLNEGVWFMYGEEETYVLKLVKCQRIACHVPTEAENLERVRQQHPGIGADQTIAFPVKLCGCYSTDGTKRYDLIVMRKIPGERLAEVLGRWYYAQQEPSEDPLLRQLWESLGRQLASFHERYGKQHGDFQPFNIFYDEVTGAICFIDVGGMGIPTMDNDVEHFREAMGLLKKGYNEQLMDDLTAAFIQGYKQAGGPVIVD